MGSGFNSASDLNDLNIHLRLAGNSGLNSNNMRLGNLSILYESSGDLLGATQVIDLDNRTLADQLLLGASPSMVQRVNLTDAIFGDSSFTENPYKFFDGTTQIKLNVDSETAPSWILVDDARFVVEEVPVISRSPREDELELRVDIEGIWRSDPLRAGAWTGPAVIDRPEDVIWDWMLVVMGLDASQIETSASDYGGLLHALRDRQTWRFARHVDVDTTKREIFEQACQDAGLMPVHDGGKFRFVADLFPPPVDAVASLRSAELGVDNLIQNSSIRHGPRTDIMNEIGLYYRRSFEGERGFSRRDNHQDDLSISSLGRVYRETLNLEWVRETPTQKLLAATILRRFSSGLRTAQVVGHEGLSNLEPGDPVLFHDTFLGHREESGLILGRASKLGVGLLFSIALPVRRERVWVDPSDDTTYIDVQRGTKLIFVFEGVLIAELFRDAVWRLKGGVLTVKDSPGEQTEIIEKTVGGISFGIDFGGLNRNSELLLTSDGDLKIWGNGGFHGRAFARSLWPILQSQTDFIEELFPGGAPAVLSFSVDLTFQHAKLAGGIATISGLTSRGFDGGRI